MTIDITKQEPQGRCKTCGRELAPRQNYCRKHKCLKTKGYSGITLICEKEVDHTGRCLFIYLGEIIENN